MACSNHRASRLPTPATKPHFCSHASSSRTGAGQTSLTVTGDDHGQQTASSGRFEVSLVA